MLHLVLLVALSVSVFVLVDHLVLDGMVVAAVKAKLKALVEVVLPKPPVV